MCCLHKIKDYILGGVVNICDLFDKFISDPEDKKHWPPPQKRENILNTVISVDKPDQIDEEQFEVLSRDMLNDIIVESESQVNY
jgi:hypothetical protein